jgi:hypothetical protein
MNFLNYNINYYTVDTKKILVESALKKINDNQIIKDAYFDLYILIDAIILNSFTPTKIDTFRKIEEMLIQPLNYIHISNEENLKFDTILNLINFKYITKIFEELNDDIGNMGIKLIDKIIKTDKIIIVI